jgi:hypothetical protein
LSNVFYRINVDYIKDFDAPIIALMGADNWATLCVLAAFMDSNGYCYPTHKTIGKLLGISEQAAGKRVRKLAEFTYNGQQVVTIHKSSNQRGEDGKFTKNNYHISCPFICIF